MHCIRALFLHHRRLAMLLVTAALCMKALIPAGYMLGEDTRVLTVQICADTIGQTITTRIALPSSGHGPDGGKAKTDSACPFTALGHAALGGADPVQLALALVVAMALAFAPRLPAAPKRILHLRPPLRGPPARA